MKPINNEVLLKPFPAKETTSTGLFIPESVRQVSNRMKVIAVGGGTHEKKMNISVGETVYRTKDWGTEVEVDGELHFLMDQDAILCKE